MVSFHWFWPGSCVQCSWSPWILLKMVDHRIWSLLKHSFTLNLEASWTCSPFQAFHRRSLGSHFYCEVSKQITEPHGMFETSLERFHDIDDAYFQEISKWNMIKDWSRSQDQLVLFLPLRGKIWWQYCTGTEERKSLLHLSHHREWQVSCPF